MPKAINRQVFGRRPTQHTIIIASGDRIRHFSFRPWQAGLVAGCAGVFLAGYLAATAYLFMRDDLIDTAHAEQARVTRRYEERIANLRAQVDRVKSQQLIDQQKIEDRISKLYQRQAILTLHHGQLEPLLDRARSAGLLARDVPVPAPRPAGDPGLEVPALSAIEAVTGKQAAAPDAAQSGLVNAFLPAEPRPAAVLQRGDPRRAGDPAEAGNVVRKVALSLRNIEADQAVKVETLTARAIKAASAIRSVLDGSGVSLSKTGGGESGKAKATGAAAQSGIGGPFVRIEDPDRFHASLVRLNHALDRLESVRSLARKLPFGRPLVEDVVTSPFGSREDPFLERMAFHPGVDLRAPRGTPVRSTGAGTVTHAGPDAGYGNMVEIDHGDGVSSRYGHLSQVLVHVGETVATGDVIGRSGSTGRSTGPHLHYEVRLDGHPVDPERFLNSGLVLQALLRK